MLKVILFVIAWPIFWNFVLHVVTYLRARMGINVSFHDKTTTFMKAFAIPPFSLLGSISPEARARGQGSLMFWGAVFGFVVAIEIYGLI